MAAALKENKLSRSFKERLEYLGCPYTDGVDESWIMEVIYKPGEPRIRLLQWLFSKFDTHLSEVLEPEYTTMDSRTDSRIQRLLYVASTLGLCKVEDADLIRGATSSSKQTAFMDQLIDLVYIMDSADDPQTKALSSPGLVLPCHTLQEQLYNDCILVDSLAATEKLDHVFMSKAKILPPDIMRSVENGWTESGFREKEQVPVPDTSKLFEKANILASEIERNNQILSHLKKNFNYPEGDEHCNSTTMRTLKLVLSELSQLVIGFCYCFENEMQQWCNRAPPNLNQLGPVFKRVHTLLQQFDTLMKGLSSIKTNYTKMTKDEQRLNLSNNRKSSDLGAISQVAMESFQECVNILEESLARPTDSTQDTINASALSSIKVIE